MFRKLDAVAVTASAAAGALTLCVAAAGAAGAPPGCPTGAKLPQGASGCVTGGTTTLTFSPSWLTKLAAEGITLKAVAPAKRMGSRFVFPIAAVSGPEYGSAQGRASSIGPFCVRPSFFVGPIAHRGGLIVSRKGVRRTFRLVLQPPGLYAFDYDRGGQVLWKYKGGPVVRAVSPTRWVIQNTPTLLYAAPNVMQPVGPVSIQADLRLGAPCR
jgi:hypothetical protein